MLGMERVQELMPGFVAGCSSPYPHVRDGHIILMRFLPVTLGMQFEALLPQVRPPQTPFGVPGPPPADPSTRPLRRIHPARPFQPIHSMGHSSSGPSRRALAL